MSNAAVKTAVLKQFFLKVSVEAGGVDSEKQSLTTITNSIFGVHY